MKFQKIHIFGAPGSGKSYLAKMLNSYYCYPILDLDNIFWDNSSCSYGIKNNPQIRNALLSKFLQNQNYIIEGVYYNWLSQAFNDADVIIVLKVNVWKRCYFILKRFCKRKIGLEKGKNETFLSTFRLLKWNFYFDTQHAKAIYNLAPNNKILEFANANDAFSYIITHNM